MDSLIYFANKIVYFLMFFGIVTILISIALKRLINSNKDSKLKVLLMGFLSNNSILNNISYSLLYLFVIFTIWFILFNGDYSNYIYNWNFYYLLIPIVIYDIINGRVLRIIVDVLEVLIIFYLNYLKYGFVLYTKVVNNAWYIKVICGLTDIFLIILVILIYFVHLKYLEEKKDGKLEKEIAKVVKR